MNDLGCWAVIKIILVNRIPGQVVSLLNSNIFKEEIMSIVLKFFSKFEEEKTLPNAFYEATLL